MSTLAIYTADRIRQSKEFADSLRRDMQQWEQRYQFARESRMDIGHGQPHDDDDAAEAASSTQLGQAVRDFRRQIAELEDVEAITERAKIEWEAQEKRNAENARIDAIFGRGASVALAALKVDFPVAASAARYDVQMFGTDQFRCRALSQHGSELVKWVTYVVADGVARKFNK